MSADELLQRIIASGADENGIRDRFGGNAALYESCLHEFMEESNLQKLRDAIDTGSYEAAFEAAHALKGLSGNLGVSGFYNAVRPLVEALRGGKGENVDGLYAEVVRQYDALRHIVFDETPAVENEITAEPSPALTGPQAKAAELKARNARLLWLMLGVAAAAIVIVGLLFFCINVSHGKKVVEESSQHLIEMACQVRLYVEDHIAMDWKLAESIGVNLVNSSYTDDDAAISEMLRSNRDMWDVSDLILYTKSGYNIYAGGGTQMNDVASDTVFNAREHGRYLSVVDSKIIYTVPVSTHQRFAGSEIAAVSVVRDMSSFLDDIDFDSFGRSAWMYMTDPQGVIISALTNPSSVKVFNIQSVMEGMTVTPVSKGDSADDFLSDPVEAAFLLSDGKKQTYAISAPISTGVQAFHLFYFVPEQTVNSTMDVFSRQLIMFSMVIILVFAAFAFLTSLYVYRSRERLFDKAILMRERMFDLLVKNTKTAFGLFTVDHDKPDYISDNIASVVGSDGWTIVSRGQGYALRNGDGTQSDGVEALSARLQSWDGSDVFRSGYLHISTAPGSPYFEFELYPVGEDGKSFVGVAKDVTQAQAREAATKDAMEMVTRSNDAKTRFLSNMSHDIRTPMNAIMNMSNFALENIDSPRTLAPYLHVIHESSEHLLSLINDVLDVSRIESGQVFVSSDPFDIGEQLQRQADMIRPLCDTKKQTLMVELDDVIGISVFGDALKVSQVIMNLLSNAVKFTPERGAVRLTAKELPSLREGLISVRFTVEDNGMGIAEADRRRIFEPFGRADSKEVSHIEGTGLGLSICKNYVEVMGGSIRCDSELGEGSVFTVELCFLKCGETAHSADAAAANNVSFLGMRCLVAEDNPINQLIAKELLERMGFIADFAGDGDEAVRMFVSSKPGTYDVIYMDIQMPVMDGYEAAVMIRACKHPQAATIPIVAMTANAFTEDVERARTVGMDAYVDKPVVSFNLIEQTAKALGSRRNTTELP